MKIHLGRARIEFPPAEEDFQVDCAAARIDPRVPERLERALHAGLVAGEEVERAVPGSGHCFLYIITV